MNSEIILFWLVFICKKNGLLTSNRMERKEENEWGHGGIIRIIYTKTWVIWGLKKKKKLIKMKKKIRVV